MSIRTAERRRSVRAVGAYPATLRDRRGRLIGRGRTANISETGVYVVIPNGRAVPTATTATLEMVLPEVSSSANAPQRTVKYEVQINRTEKLGDWHGLGIELLRKLR